MMCILLNMFAVFVLGLGATGGWYAHKWLAVPEQAKAPLFPRAYRTVIDGASYDTSKATLIGAVEKENYALYVTKKGNYFRHRYYPASFGRGEYHYITPITLERAQYIAAEHGFEGVPEPTEA